MHMDCESKIVQGVRNREILWEIKGRRAGTSKFGI